MIEEILPAAVVAEDTRGERLETELFAEERAVVERAVEKRRREFVTGRACARSALARLGVEPCAIASGERGQPLWPRGVVGSITHCDGYRGCAVARAGRVVGVGIDAEPHAPLPDGVLGQIARAEEHPVLARLARAEPEVHWDRLLFCAKEAVYKVWFPLAACWLGFEDATLTLDPGSRAFQARLLKPWPRRSAGPARADAEVAGSPPGTGLGGESVEEVGMGGMGIGGAGLGGAGCGEAALPEVLEGRWLVREGLVLSAIALTRAG